MVLPPSFIQKWKIPVRNGPDLGGKVNLTFSYADKAGLDFGPLATRDFFERLVFSCLGRWGLVIEMVIEAFTLCQIEGHKVCSVEHFSCAYAKTYSTPTGYSPFTMPNYRDGFDPQKLMEVLNRTK